MIRLFSLAAAFACVAVARADDAPAYSGTWTKDADGLAIVVAFKKAGEVDWKVEAGDNGLTMHCTYTVEKDGLLKLKMVKKVVKGEFPFEPKDGFTFQFKFKIDKAKATLSDFDANENADGGKGVAEGEYVKKEDK